MRTSPSCNCCGEECLVWDAFIPSTIDDYSAHWTEIAGTWAYGDVSGTGYMETATTGGIFLNTQAGDDRWTARNKFDITPTGNNSWRVGVGADISNYVFAEFNITKSGAFYFMQVRLGEVVAGSASYLADAPHGTTDVSWSSSSFYADFSLDDDGALSIAIGISLMSGEEGIDGHLVNYSVSLQPLTARDATPLGRYLGIFAVSLTNTLRISESKFYHNYPVAAECPKVMQSCIRGLPLPEFLLEISDSSPASYNYVGSCDFDCNKIVGSFTMAMPTAGAFYSDSNCSWTHGISDTDYDDCSPTSEFVQIAFSMSYVDLGGGEFDETSLDRTLAVTVIYSVSFGGLGTNYTVARFTKTHSVAMEDWVVDEWINLTEVGSSGCNASANIACRIKRTS